ncbi:MAG: hypothetical protein C4324_10065 [Blastocatellia bacterium]
MDGESPEIRSLCPVSEISAYLDGELASAVSEQVERHIAICATCRAEANFQKSLLNHLSSELATDSLLDLPDDFSRRVVAVAESRVSGLRSSAELRSASFILLAFGGFAAFFITSIHLRAEVPAISVAEKLIGAAMLLLHFLYDLSIAIAATTRAFSRFWTALAISAFAVVIFIAVLAFAFRRFKTRRRR